MDLKQLDSIDTSNAAEVKKLQEFLRSRGFYKGPIDGKWGGGTTEGAVKLRDELKTNANTELQISNNQREANDPVNNAIRGATEVGPYAAGATIGAGLGHLGARALKAQDTDIKGEAKRLAANPKIAGSVAEGQMKGMGRSRLASTLGQFAGPAAFLGSAEYIDREIAPKYEGETAKWIGLGANLDRGLGIGAAGHQLFDLKNRFKSPVDPEDAGIIRTRAALERDPQGNLAKALQQPNAAPDPIPAALPPPADASPASAPEPKPLTPGTKAHMVAQAKEFGIKGTSRMTKSQLADALAEAMGEHGNKRTVGKRITKGAGKAAIPAAVGSYLAATGDSEAADATVGERATNAAGNFAAGAGGAYAGSKLVDALRSAAPTAMRALGGGLSMMAPGAAADITDGLATPPVPDEQELMARNQEVSAMPFLRHLTPGHAESYEAAQVPAPNPERRSMGPRLDAEPIQNRIRRMSSTGATPEQIADFLNGINF